MHALLGGYINWNSTMNKRLPRYLLDRFQLVGQVTFSVLFAVVFMNLYIPFSKTAWLELGYSSHFLYTLLFFCMSVMVLVVSRIVMYRTKYLFEMRIWHYVLWCIAEIVLICGIYTGITVMISEVPGDMTVYMVFLKSLLYGTISLAVPYVISTLYFMLVEKEKIIRLMNYGNVVTDEPESDDDDQKITLFDIGGTLRFSVRRRNIYYIESDDNYIKVWYDDGNGELKQYMLRCRLKTVEETFRDSTLVRCHRKYVVNTEHVKVLRKEGDAFFLELDSENIQAIPVTKTYEKAVIAKFS